MPMGISLAVAAALATARVVGPQRVHQTAAGVATAGVMEAQRVHQRAAAVITAAQAAKA